MTNNIDRTADIIEGLINSGIDPLDIETTFA